MFCYQTNFLKKAVFLEKIVKNHLIDKNSKTPKNDRSSGGMILKLPEIKHPVVKISALLTSLEGVRSGEYDACVKTSRPK